MNLIELERALRQLRLGGVAAVLETRLRQAQAEAMAPIDLISCLVTDELTRRSERLLDRRRKQAAFRDVHKTLDNFDFTFNPKMNRSLVFDLATCAFLAKREDALFLGPGGTGKSHLAQAIGFAVIQQGHRVLYRETHALLDDLAEAQLAGTRKEYVTDLTTVPLLIIDDLGMRKLPHTAAEDLLEIVMRRYEKASTLITSNRPVEDWGKLLGDTPAVTAMLDRLLHHAHVLTCGPRSWRTYPSAVFRSISHTAKHWVWRWNLSSPGLSPSWVNSISNSNSSFVTGSSHTEQAAPTPGPQPQMRSGRRAGSFLLWITERAFSRRIGSSGI